MSTNLIAETELVTRWERLKTSGFAPMIPLAIVVLLAILGPMVTSFEPERAAPTEALLGPDATHWFGTNSYGGDIFSRAVHAARLDLLIGAVSVALSFAIGTPLGALIGFYRGWGSTLVIRVLDFMQALPVFIVAMALVTVRGPNVVNVILVIAFLNVPIFARLVRSEVLAIRDSAFVEAGRCVGNSDRRLITRYVLPNALGSSLAQVSTSVGWALLLTAGLSFVGAGVRPPTAEWGAMISEGARYMITGQWWISVFPGIALGIAVLGFALAGDYLRQRFDVRWRSR